jgi:hypothetical protein
MLALGAIALLIVASHIVVQWRIDLVEQDTRVVNLAGRQRMLSQTIAKLSLEIVALRGSQIPVALSDELRRDTDSFAAVHYSLQRGDMPRGISACNNTDILAMFEKTTPHYAAIVSGGRRILRLSDLSSVMPVDEESWRVEMALAVSDVLDHEADFLSGMEDIVFALDADSRSKIEELGMVAISLGGVILALILLMAALIFEPVVRLIGRQFQELEVRTEELTSALELVKQLTGMLPICAACKKIRNAEGEWNSLELYIEQHSEAVFTHSVCPECEKALYPRPGRK